MTTKAKVVLGIVIVAGLAGMIVGGVFFATSNLPKTADAFFSHIAQGNATTAYQSTAREFQAGTSEAEFLQFLKTTSLTEYQSTSWSSRSIDGDRGTLEGTVTTKSGGKIPLKIELIKEGGSWKIYYLNKPKGGLSEGDEDESASQTDEPTPAVPGEAEAKQLARETLLSFYQAVKANDFTAFYMSISPTWQRETTAADLQSNFQSFAKVDTNTLFDVVTKPVGFTQAPAVNDHHHLVLQGQTPEGATQSPILTFELKYRSDGGQWKLVGIEVNAK